MTSRAQFTETTVFVNLFGDEDEDADLSLIPDSFWGTGGKSRDVHFHIPGNETGEAACKARLTALGVTLATADEEMTCISDDARDLLYVIVGDLHLQGLVNKRWARTAEAVFRLPNEMRSAHPGYAAVALDIIDMHRSKLDVDHRRAMAAYGI